MTPALATLRRAVDPKYWYPAAFAAGYVLLSFTATPTPLLGLWRPLVLAIVGAIVMQISLAAALRDGRRASLLTSLLLLALAAAWLLAVVAMVIGVWWVIVNYLRRRRDAPVIQFSWHRLATSLRVFAIVFALAASIPAVGAAAVTADLHPRGGAQTDGGGPEIVVLMLDGYPRSDVLRSDFDYDNTWFEWELEQRGFTVAANSRSNYTTTWPTLASMFHMRYVEDISELQPAPSDHAEQYRRLMRAINVGPGLDALREHGYRIATVPDPFTSTAILVADDFLDSGHMTTLELSLIQHSTLRPLLRGPVADWILDQQRDRLRHGFRILASPMGDGEGPRFAFIHLLSPHAPVLFEADGSPAPPPHCFPDCPLWGYHDPVQEEGLARQLHHLNGLVLSALDERIERDPSAVIIVMSDHGKRRIGSPQEHAFLNFFASRTPGRGNVFADDTSPVDVLPQMFNAYLGTDLPLEGYRAWQSEPNAPLTLSPFEKDPSPDR